MTGNVQSDTSGHPPYELDTPVPQEATTAPTEQKIQDKLIKSYEEEDIQKYGVNSPIREIIHTKIVRQELPKICITSEETKTTE